MLSGTNLGHRLGTGQVLEVRLRCILSVVHRRRIRILKSNSQDFSWLIIWGFKLSCVAQADVIWNIFRSQNHFRAHFHQRETRRRHWLPESCGSPLAAQVSSSASPSSSPRGKSAERTDWALPRRNRLWCSDGLESESRDKRGFDEVWWEQVQVPPVPGPLHTSLPPPGCRWLRWVQSCRLLALPVLTKKLRQRGEGGDQTDRVWRKWNLHLRSFCNTVYQLLRLLIEVLGKIHRLMFKVIENNKCTIHHRPSFERTSRR